MRRFFHRLGVGFLISIPITVILTGGVQDAIGMLLISIVCTAGIGLVFWIPVWWFVGMLALDVVVKAATGKPDQKPTPVPNPTELSSRDSGALKAYVAKAITSGMDADEMTRRLQQNGWQKADIESAYQSSISYISTTQEA